MTGTRLVRDRLTWLAYLAIGLYGFFLYGFGPTTPLLREELGISRTRVGLYGTAFAAGAVIAGVVGAAVIRRIGRRTALWGGAAMLAAGCLTYAFGGSFGLTVVGIVACGIAGSGIVNTSNASLMDEHGPAGAAALSEGNAVGGAMGTLAPLLVGAAVAVDLGWRVGLSLTVVLALALFVAFRGVAIPDAALPPGSEGGRPSRLPRDYWVNWGVLACVIAVEFCLALWATDLLRSRTGLSAAAATAAWSGTLAGVFLSRLLGGRIAVRYPVDTLLHVSLAVLLAGFALFWVPTAAWIAVVGLFVCGLGLGLLFPLTTARAIAASGGRSDQAANRASLSAGLAVGLAPFLLGAAADRIGTHAAFLVVPILIGLALLGLALSRPDSDVAAA